MIVLIPIGEVEEATVKALGQSLAQVFGQKTRIADSKPLPRDGWDQSRGQYLGPSLLSLIPLPDLDNRVLGVVDVDISAAGLNFVFGLSSAEGKRALISLQRLRQELYGFSRDEDFFLLQALQRFKETLLLLEG